MTADLRAAFSSIGAEVDFGTGVTAFEIDVRQRAAREVYFVRQPLLETFAIEPLDVKPKLRHLVLEVSAERRPLAARYLCGQDERHWFVASLPLSGRSGTVRGAMEALKPAVVLREQKQRGVRHRRHRRRTVAYVRQGEWFFLPRPMMHVGERAVRNGELVRGAGKPHRVGWLYRTGAGDEVFVRGAVEHPDHETLYLQVWHRAVQNNEAAPTPAARPFMRMSYLD